jgi:guanylate kinase
MVDGLLLILSAPSGAGKTTLAHMLIDSQPGRALSSVSYTTRAPRGRERNGFDYHFIDAEAFRSMVDRGEFLEWAEVHGHWYGTHKSAVESARRGQIVIFDIDVQGGTTIKGKHPEAASVFIVPPSMAELERRLRDRRTDPEEVIRRRMMAARNEMERGCASYDYLVINQDLQLAFEDLCAVVRAEGCRRGRADLSRLGIGRG